MATILIIGQHGQVSSYLQKVLADSNLGKVLVADREKLDLMKLDQIQSVLSELQVDVIVNPAAYTAVDLAEQEEESADKVNHLAVAQIADFCAKTTTPLIHFSTDYVFDGESKQAYVESDIANPTGVYGKTKLAGEQAILNSSAPALILRTSWVYSNLGKNFYKTMLALAETRSELTVVADQIGSPTYAESIAKATVELLDIILRQGEIKTTQTGVYHFTCGGETSWYDFAKNIFAQNDIHSMTVSPIPTEQYPTPAKRPAFSVLNNGKLLETFGISLPDWHSALVTCVSETKSIRG